MGFRRSDGKIGIRNYVAVIFTVECARKVAFSIGKDFSEVRVFGFSGCQYNEKAFKTLVGLGKNPNIGAVLVVSLGCEGIKGEKLTKEISNSGKRTEHICIQKTGGTLKSIYHGRRKIIQLIQYISKIEKKKIMAKDLVIGVECGGSDSTSALTANPAAGFAVDLLLENKATVIFEEIRELLGCKSVISNRIEDNNIRLRVIDIIEQARKFSVIAKNFAITPGNIDGGLTTIEEKSLGALAKTGSKPITGTLEIGEYPDNQGLFLLNTVSSPKSSLKCLGVGGDAAGITSLISSGAQIVIFTTGRGNVIGSAISPVIKVCGNQFTNKMLSEDFDIDASKIITEDKSIKEIGLDIFHKVLNVAEGERTKSEILEHEEFFIPYRY